MPKKQLVLAFFENEAAADEAVNQMKQWDKASDDILLGAIGVLVKDEKGKIKSHKLGDRHTGTGAIIGVMAGVLSGGLSLLAGAILGGVLGASYQKGLGMSKEDLARIDRELDGGKAAVGILINPEESEPILARLTQLGGRLETHEVTEEALEQATSAAENMPDEAGSEGAAT